MGLGDYFRKRKSRKKEMHADEQYLDALEIIKESMQTYLELLARAKQDEGMLEIGHEPDDDAARLQAKLNSNFEYHNRSWNGELKITHTIISNCELGPNEKILKIE